MVLINEISGKNALADLKCDRAIVCSYVNTFREVLPSRRYVRLLRKRLGVQVHRYKDPLYLYIYNHGFR